MHDIYAVITDRQLPAKEMDCDNRSVGEGEEYDDEETMEFSISLHWSVSDMSLTSDTESEDVSMDTETLIVSVANGSDDDNGIVAIGAPRVGTDRRELWRIVRLILLFVFGYDPLNGRYPIS